MSLRLHQTIISCPVCGDFMWEIWTIHPQNETLDMAICGKCNPKKWTEIVMKAVKFDLLTVDQKRNITEKPQG